MSFEHIALIVGVTAAVLALGTALFFNVLGRYLRNRNRTAHAKMLRVTERLNKFKALPVLWVTAITGVAMWAITRIAMSYM